MRVQVTLRGRLYAIGGEINAGPCETADAYSVLNTVERYDPALDQWDNVAPLVNRRYAHSAAVFQDKIWVCGGHFDPNYETSLSPTLRDDVLSEGSWELMQGPHEWV